MSSTTIIGLKLDYHSLWEPVLNGVCNCDYPFKSHKFCPSCELPTELFRSIVTGKETVYSDLIGDVVDDLQKVGVSMYYPDTTSSDVYLYLTNSPSFFKNSVSFNFDLEIGDKLREKVGNQVWDQGVFGIWELNDARDVTIWSCLVL